VCSAHSEKQHGVKHLSFALHPALLPREEKEDRRKRPSMGRHQAKTDEIWSLIFTCTGTCSSCWLQQSPSMFDIFKTKTLKLRTWLCPVLPLSVNTVFMHSFPSYRMESVLL